MTHGKGGSGGGGAPPEDRTLLDPLNADELKALREARQNAAPKGKSAVAHQIVIGPDAGEDIGDAPTRAFHALPAFENPGASLDKLKSGRPGPAAPGLSHGPSPAEPMSLAGTTQPAAPPAASSLGPQNRAGPPAGFGENTLMWMQPAKSPIPVTSTAGTVGDLGLKPKEAAQRRWKLVGIACVIVLLLGALAFSMRKTELGVLELYTTPAKATVFIDGKASPERAPVKLTLLVGRHDIEVALDGHAPEKFAVDIQAGAPPIRKDVDLTPVSREGLMTVSIAVKPLAARVTFDKDIHMSKQSLKLGNVDPKIPHRIVVEAGGYVKIEQDIAANELKPTYTFTLQRDAEAEKP